MRHQVSSEEAIRRKSRADNANDAQVIEQVYRAVEEHILNTHRLCSVDEVAKITGLSKSQCRRILNKLVSEGRIAIAYEGRGRPTIYIPKYMFEDILRTQAKPAWVDAYSFQEKKKLLSQIDQIRKRIGHYEMLERLLYATGRPLEEAVAYALELLGFENVVHHTGDDTADISFLYKGIKYLVEVEGTQKQANKNKVAQLDGWVRQEVDRGADPSKVMGILVVNHFRNKDPKDRGSPLTPHAKRFLRLYSTHMRFFTTLFLFKIVREVINGSLKAEEARELVVRGESYE